jgi:serine protease
MSRFLSAGLAALAVASLAACSDTPVNLAGPDDTPSLAANVNASAREEIMGGEVVVAVREGFEVADVARAHGLGLSERGYANAFAVLRGAVGAEHANINALRNDERVEWAEPNYLRQPTVKPELWAFLNDGSRRMKFTTGRSSGSDLPSQYSPVADADIDNDDATYAAGGGSVVIGSIDTGVDLDHPEFIGRLIAGRDWYSNDDVPEDENGHGSHTSGTMAGSTVGVAGVSGAASNVKIYVQRVCGKRGCPSAAIASAIRAAASEPGMVAMNLSLGGSASSTAEIRAIAFAVDTANVLVIASSGNNGTSTVSCPACNAKAISVSATTWSDALASYSNYGTGLDISAPGGQCYSNSTAEGCIYSAYLNGGYTYMQGTSMAAPQVTGVAAIVASKLGLRGSDLRNRILSTTDDKGTSGYDTKFGSGRLNAYRAVTQ